MKKQMLLKVAVIISIIGVIAAVYGFKTKSGSNKFIATKAIYPGTPEGWFSTGDDPGEPFEVYVNPSNTSEVVGCVPKNNPAGSSTFWAATGSYSPTGGRHVTGFSCTYTVYTSTPIEQNTVNYTGNLTNP